MIFVIISPSSSDGTWTIVQCVPDTWTIVQCVPNTWTVVQCDPDTWKVAQCAPDTRASDAFEASMTQCGKPGCTRRDVFVSYTSPPPAHPARTLRGTSTTSLGTVGTSSSPRARWLRGSRPAPCRPRGGGGAPCWATPCAAHTRRGPGRGAGAGGHGRGERRDRAHSRFHSSFPPRVNYPTARKRVLTDSREGMHAARPPPVPSSWSLIQAPGSGLLVPSSGSFPSLTVPRFPAARHHDSAGLVRRRGEISRSARGAVAVDAHGADASAPV
jgi:hypothetical protein